MEPLGSGFGGRAGARDWAGRPKGD